MLLCLRAEAQLIDVVNDFPQVVPALYLVLDLAKNLTDFVFDGVRASGLLLEPGQVGEELTVNKVAQIVTGQSLVVVELPILALGRRPGVPPVRRVEDIGVLLAL